MAKSSAREKVQLRSTGKQKNGKPTGYYKTTVVNKRNMGEKKLECMKFDPCAWNTETGKVGMRVLFKQKKIAK
ncbi:MAG: ribosomal protein L33 [uncultured bacterium]|nr:MAG: ribosomal protein L33 [uncultured bacterium]OGT26931.1 MAG: 50S ribosomal protein L33 [Gammaproteobacteria bacterium RIFCSPHIGHO2_02_FULL_42_43]OGT52150.1 MAG: 50S ribosomal protein L33 [Gammaproteobacteria bacterium RIFCSPHIGHO2_12_FULL_41_25]OGT62587.1 MAG: 50S ribosomal protein L33 [Gammaproteobacteria bacterium RIFCSPLOWO2_02_FULL_42_14]OGT86570.1 MAG: 50S ribosomal protein L33 [Gammaproteobacteria bacterium RIFCSPLOWO2_12_FULL_42_18]